MKYYAVKVGARPGIYEDWPSCEAQVKGFPGAVYKSFKTRQEAQDFLDGEALAAAPTAALEHPYPEIYVDGSYRADTGEYSYGMVVLTEGEEICLAEKFSDQEDAVMRNVAGEIRGARAAMEYALDQGWPGIYLYHDYAGIAHWCTGAWKANKAGTLAYRAYYLSVADQLDVIFVKVKGHSHDRYNDLADQKAKEVLGIAEKRDYSKAR